MASLIRTLDKIPNASEVTIRFNKDANGRVETVRACIRKHGAAMGEVINLVEGLNSLNNVDELIEAAIAATIEKVKDAV